jgi:hypothetical protein
MYCHRLYCFVTGYNVSIVQNPTLSLEDDVAVTKRVIAAQNGPVVLVVQEITRVLLARCQTVFL